MGAPDDLLMVREKPMRRDAAAGDQAAEAIREPIGHGTQIVVRLNPAAKRGHHIAPCQPPHDFRRFQRMTFLMSVDGDRHGILAVGPAKRPGPRGNLQQFLCRTRFLGVASRYVRWSARADRERRLFGCVRQDACRRVRFLAGAAGNHGNLS
jgi:hypothetical protein